jgi:glycosyltransferase involved in cell wall biosynthesis
MNLAEATAEHAPTVFVSFGRSRRTERKGKLQIEIYPVRGDTSLTGLVSLGFLRELISADVVHCHQFRTTVSSLSILASTALGARTFVTELGVSPPDFPARVSTSDFVTGFLHISNFAERMLPEPRSHVVYGGVNSPFLQVEEAPSERTQVLCVARLLPHKGTNYLVEAVAPDCPLELIGRPYDERFVQLLRELATGKRVTFSTGADDRDLAAAYRRSFVTVLPSVYRDVYGREYPAPELLGLVLLESMACETPVICTSVGSLPEIVDDGVTGFIVPPNDSAALHDRIEYLRANASVAREMGRRGRIKVMSTFSWDKVARQCLAIYRGSDAAQN